MTKYTPEQKIDRFWSHVDRKADLDVCWEWTIARDRDGYGSVWWDGRQQSAHRISYLLAHGNLPDLQIRHTCDNPPCVNPAHLVAGTPQDNSRDMTTRGRQAKNEIHWHCIVSDEQVELIRLRYAQGGISYAQLGNQFGISGQEVGHIVRHENRT